MPGLIRKKRARIAAVMQLLALFVLQVALLTPPIAIALATAKPYNVCQGDHALCGCPPLPYCHRDLLLHHSKATRLLSERTLS